MEQRFETFTVLINRIGRSIKRLKAGQMAQLELKGPYVSCLYYLYRCGPMTAAELCERCDEDKVPGFSGAGRLFAASGGEKIQEQAPADGFGQADRGRGLRQN